MSTAALVFTLICYSESVHDANKVVMKLRVYRTTDTTQTSLVTHCEWVSFARF